jgi:SpoVK/Ycf46/Vps4 family AAA+-type ATPase
MFANSENVELQSIPAVDYSREFSTKSDGDCAFHAIFGQFNTVNQEFICPNVPAQRAMLAEGILASPVDSEIYQKLIDSIKQFAMDDNERAATQNKILLEFRDHYKIQLQKERNTNDCTLMLREQIQKRPEILKVLKENSELRDLMAQFHECYVSENTQLTELLKGDSSMSALVKNFMDAKEEEHLFKLNNVVTRDIITAYVEDRIKPTGKWLLQSEIYIIALIHNISVVYHIRADSHHYKQIETINPGQSRVVAIGHNGLNHFERLNSQSETAQLKQALLISAKEAPEKIESEQRNADEAVKDQSKMTIFDIKQITDVIGGITTTLRATLFAKPPELLSVEKQPLHLEQPEKSVNRNQEKTLSELKAKGYLDYELAQQSRSALVASGYDFGITQQQESWLKYSVDNASKPLFFGGIAGGTVAVCGAAVPPALIVGASITAAAFTGRVGARKFQGTLQEVSALFCEAIHNPSANDNHSKIDEKLQLEFSGRWFPIRFLRWFSMRYEEYAMGHFFRASNYVKLASEKAYDEFELAYKDLEYSSDDDSKRLKVACLFGQINILCDETNYPVVNIYGQRLSKDARKARLINALNKINAIDNNFFSEYFKYIIYLFDHFIDNAHDLSAYLLTGEALRIMCFKELTMLGYLSEKGSVLAICMQFLQAIICYTAHIKKYPLLELISEQQGKISGLDPNKYYLFIREKFEACVTGIQNFKAKYAEKKIDPKINIICNEIKKIAVNFFYYCIENEIFRDTTTLKEFAYKNGTIGNEVKLIGLDEQTKILESCFQEVIENPITRNHFLLLSGMSGVGKKTLIKKMCQQFGFIQYEFKLSGSYDQLHGGFSHRLVEHFKAAKEYNGFVCVVLPNIDAWCLQFEGKPQAGYHNPMADIKTLLSELQSLPGSKVIAVATTEHIDTLAMGVRDMALTQYFLLPDITLRTQLFAYGLELSQLVDSQVINRLAEATSGWSPDSILRFVSRVLSKSRAKPRLGINDFVSEYEESRKILIKEAEKLSLKIEPPKLIPSGEELFAGLIFKDCNLTRHVIDLIAYLKTPARYHDKKGKLNPATLFEGPPGTGKTSIGEIIAKHAECMFIYVPAGNYKFDSGEKLSHLFNFANRFEKVVLFFDEIDAIVQDGSPVKEKLLTEIEGFKNNKDRIVVILAATNHKELFTPASLSRFRFTANVPLPDEEGRKLLFKKYLRELENFQLDPKEDPDALYTILAKHSHGKSPRDIEAFQDAIKLRCTPKGNQPPPFIYTIAQIEEVFNHWISKNIEQQEPVARVRR